MSLKLLFANKLAYLFLLFFLSSISCENSNEETKRKRLSLEEIDIKVLSEIRFEVRNLPTKLDQCLSYLQRLNERLPKLLKSSNETEFSLITTTTPVDKGKAGKLGSEFNSDESQWRRPVDNIDLLVEISELLRREKKWAFGNNNLVDYLDTCVATIKVKQCESDLNRKFAEPIKRSADVTTTTEAQSPRIVGLDDDRRREEEYKLIKSPKEKLSAQNVELQERIADLESQRDQLQIMFENELQRINEFHAYELDSCSMEAQKTIKQLKDILEMLERNFENETRNYEKQLGLLETKVDQIRPKLKSTEEKRDARYDALAESEELNNSLLKQIEDFNTTPNEEEYDWNPYNQQQMEPDGYDDDEIAREEAEAMEDDEDYDIDGRSFSWQIPITGGNNWRSVPVVNAWRRPNVF